MDRLGRLAALALVCLATACASTQPTEPPRGAFFPGGGGSGHTIKDEDTPVTTRSGLAYQGAGVSIVDDAGNDQTEVVISGVPPDNTVATAKIQDSAITSAKVAADTLVAADLASDSVEAAEIAAGAVGSSELASTTVTPGTYGSATQAAQCTKDADGRDTACANVTITPPASSVTVSPAIAGQTNAQSAFSSLSTGKVDVASAAAVNEGAGSPVGVLNNTAPQYLWFQNDSNPLLCWFSITAGTGGWAPCGGMYPQSGLWRSFNTALGLYIGNGADATTDAGVRFGVGVAPFSTWGWDFPVTVPKWKTVEYGATATALTWTTGSHCLGKTGQSAPEVLNSIDDYPECARDIPDDHEIKFGRYSFRLPAVAGLLTTDNIELWLWGCPQAFTDLAGGGATCVKIGSAALAIIDSSATAGKSFKGDLSAVAAITANTYDYYVVGAVAADNLDGSGDATFTLVGEIEVITGPDLP